MLLNFRVQAESLDVRNVHGANFSFAFQQSENGVLVLWAIASDAALACSHVHVASLAADEGFVRFDFFAESADVRKGLALHGETDSMQHEPRGLLSDSERASNFVGTDSVLAVRNHPTGGKPFVESERGVLKNRSDFHGELTACVVILALPHLAGRDEPHVLAVGQETPLGQRRSTMKLKQFSALAK